MIYLDYAATTPINKEVLSTYTKLLDSTYGNPESIHAIGMEAHKLVETSRSTILDLLKLDNKYDVVFTSGASESNNLAIKGVALKYQNKGKHIITTNVEHASIMNTCKQLEKLGFQVTYLPVDSNGCVHPKQVEQAIKDDTILVSIMCVNNEIGSINPIHDISQIVRAHHIPFHVDYVQACGKIEMDMKDCDLATLSAHKIHGLKGSGVLVKKASIELEPVICGGSQEKGMRGGTNNAPTNIVFAKTLRLALQSQKSNFQQISKLHDYLYENLSQIEGVEINSPKNGSPFILNFRTPLGSEIMMNALQAKGFLVSARSTCASNYQSASHVLLAIGLSEAQANSSIRVSMQSEVTMEQIVTFVKAVEEIIEKYKR